MKETKNFKRGKIYCDTCPIDDTLSTFLEFVEYRNGSPYFKYHSGYVGYSKDDDGYIGFTPDITMYKIKLSNHENC